jgi:hypothetical protein
LRRRFLATVFACLDSGTKAAQGSLAHDVGGGRRLASPCLEVGEDRTRFFAFGGIFMSVVFALVIFCDIVGVLLVPACAK